jgi:RNA polymerase sigma-70 factor (ECF subfamily)
MNESGDGSSSEKRQWFTTTHWSVVLAARGDDATKAREALETLCRSYWAPLYAYIRREGYGVEDAQDLTQEFFRRLLEKDYLAHLRDQRGKFRSFLLTFLKHFLSDQRDRAAAQKRGSGKVFISLDDTAAAEAGYQVEALGDPEQLFERQWAKTILERALQRLRREYAAAGKAILFDRLKDLQPGEQATISYAELGTQLGVTEAAIKSSVHRLRRRHGELLREEIAHTVSRPEEINEEIRYLLKIVSA